MTVYNQDPATRGQVSNLLTTIPGLKQTYNGVELQVNTRLSKATMFGGLTIGRDYGDKDSGDLNNPNLLINNHGRDRLRLALPGSGGVQLPASRPRCSSPARSARQQGLPQCATTSSRRRSCLA